MKNLKIGQGMKTTRNTQSWQKLTGFSLKISDIKRLRTILIFGMIFSSLVSYIWISYLTTWYSPIIKPNWIVVSESYGTNLMVPHNVHGNRSAVRLSNEIENSLSKNKENDLAGPIESLSYLENIEKVIQTNKKWQDSSVNIIVIHAHGLVDEKGAYLLKDWSPDIRINSKEPEEKDKIRLESLLAKISKETRNKKNVIVLDCELSLTYLEIGIWENKFTEEVQTMNEFVESLSNITLFLSSRSGQLSRHDRKNYESLFGRLWREEISNAAELGPTYNMKELFANVSEKVNKESLRNYGRPQEPLVIPFNEKGEKRAEGIEINALKGYSGITDRTINLRPLEIISKSISNNRNGLLTSIDTEESKEVDKTINNLWSEYERLSTTNPHPVSFHPYSWSIYKASCIRYEELIRVKDLEQAQEILTQVDEIKKKLENRDLDIMPINIETSMAYSDIYFQKENAKTKEMISDMVEKNWHTTGSDLDTVIMNISKEYKMIKEQEVKTDIKVSKEPTSDTEENNLNKTNDEILKDRTLNKEVVLDETKDSTKETTIEKPYSIDKEKKSKIEKPDAKVLYKKETTSNIKKSDDKSSKQMEKSINSLIKTDADAKTNSQLDKVLIRILLEVILEKTRSESADLKSSTEWIDRILPLNTIYPVELQIISLAKRDLTQKEFNHNASERKTSLQNIIDLSILSEKAFSGISNNVDREGVFMNASYFWLKPLIVKADQNFQKAWDATFSSNETERKKSNGFQTEALVDYRSILEYSESIHKSIETYYTSMDRVLELSIWSLRNDIIESIYSDNAFELNNLSRLEKVWLVLDTVSEILQKESDDSLTIEERKKSIDELERQINSLRISIKELEIDYEVITQKLIEGNIKPVKEQLIELLIENALRIPSSKKEHRFAMLKTLTIKEGQEPSFLQDRTISKSNPLAIASIYNFLYRIQSKRLQISEDILFNDSTFLSGMSTVLPMNRLEAFRQINVNHKAKSMLGSLYSKYYNRSKNDNWKSFWKLDRMIRTLPLSMISEESDLLIKKRIVERNTNHLNDMALRMWSFHWGSINKTTLPYYKKAGFLILNEALKISENDSAHLKESENIKRLLLDPALPEFKAPSYLILSGYPDLDLSINLDNSIKTLFPSGEATVLIDTDKSFKVLSNKDMRITLNSLKDSTTETFLLKNSLWEDSLKNTGIQSKPNIYSIIMNFVFRGNYVERKSALKVINEPDWTDNRPAPPKGGSISVSADIEVMEKFGYSQGEIVFVLDCSGSMGISPGTMWTENVKYDQAVKSVLHTIKELPIGSRFSIWVFGESVGELKTAESLKTIRRVVPAVTVDNDRDNLIETIKSKISYPACEPWNKSPIIETIKKSLSDFTDKDTPKVMIVITDGQDNDDLSTPSSILTKGKESKTNTITSLKSTSPDEFSQRIRELFNGTSVSLNIIGYRLNKSNFLNAENQFSVVKDLPVPGTFAFIDNYESLIRHMKSILRRKMSYRIASEKNREVYKDLSKGVEIQPIGTTERWFSPTLEKEVYKIWLNTEQRIDSQVFIEDGRRLLLTLRENLGSKKVSFKRDSWLSREYSWRPTNINSGWRMTWIGSKLNASDLNLMIGLDMETISDREISGDFISSQEPKDWNVSITPWNQNQNQFSGDVTRLWNYPSFVWNIRLKDWIHNQTRVRIQTDIQSGRKFKETVTLFYKKDYSSPYDITGKTYLIKGHTAYIEKFERMKRWFHDTDTNQTSQRECWILRVIHNPGFTVRGDLIFERQEDNDIQYRFYKESSITETIIWSSKDISMKDTLPTMVTLTSVNENDFKDDSSRIHLDLGNELPIPTENDRIPLPILIKEYKSQTDPESPFKTLPDALLPNKERIISETISPTSTLD